jgi:hypothetical protein
MTGRLSLHKPVPRQPTQLRNNPEFITYALWGIVRSHIQFRLVAWRLIWVNVIRSALL